MPSPFPKPNHPLEPKTTIPSVTINPHMAVISVHVGKNMVEDVLLDGGFGVNIITKELFF
jgi:hypothetical protein